MAEMKESSVLFSLNQLMSLEQQRLKEEEEAAQRRALAEAEARAEAERRAKEAELARIRAEEERRRLEEQRAREEAARLEALRQGEVERARVEAEQRARMEALAKQQEHERAMAQLTQDQHKKRLQKMVAAISVGGVLLLGSALGVYFGKIKPEAEAEQARQAAAIADQEAEQQRLKGELEARNKQLALLNEQLQSARTEKERLELQRQIQAINDKPVGGGHFAPRPSAPAPTAPKKKCNQGDPMCVDF